jgi:hypothetical protein
LLAVATTEGVTILDVSGTPHAPTLIGNVPTGAVDAVQLTAEWLFVMPESSDETVLAIPFEGRSEPDTSLAQVIRVPGGATAMNASDEVLVVASREAGLFWFAVAPGNRNAAAWLPSLSLEGP